MTCGLAPRQTDPRAHARTQHTRAHTDTHTRSLNLSPCPPTHTDSHMLTCLPFPVHPSHELAWVGWTRVKEIRGARREGPSGDALLTPPRFPSSPLPHPPSEGGPGDQRYGTKLAFKRPQPRPHSRGPHLEPPRQTKLGGGYCSWGPPSPLPWECDGSDCPTCLRSFRPWVCVDLGRGDPLTSQLNQEGGKGELTTTTTHSPHPPTPASASSFLTS